MIEIKDLSVFGRNEKKLLDNINLQIVPGEKLGITGPSGSGKTTIFKTIMRVLDPTCDIKSGDIFLDDVSLLELPIKKFRDLCGSVIGFIPQNPMTAFDKAYTVGETMVETFVYSLGKEKNEAEKIALEALEKVNINDNKRVFNLYPSECSGGMLQRITLAMIIVGNPQYVLADEPTAFLDEDNRKMVVELLDNYLSDSAIFFASHDLDAITKLCGTVWVIEDGELKNHSLINDFLNNPSTEWERYLKSQLNKKGGDGWEWKKY